MNETAAYFTVLIISILGLWAYRHVTVFNQSDEGDPGHKSNRDKQMQAKLKAPDFIFIDVVDQGITCKYKGLEVMYTTVVNDMVHFFWTDSRKEALPQVSYPKNHTMGLERMMERAVLNRFEIKPVMATGITKRRDGEFSVISYEGKTSAAGRFRDKKNKIELTF